jgi:hypothetical protein
MHNIRAQDFASYGENRHNMRGAVSGSSTLVASDNHSYSDGSTAKASPSASEQPKDHRTYTDISKGRGAFDNRYGSNYLPQVPASGAPFDARRVHVFVLPTAGAVWQWYAPFAIRLGNHSKVAKLPTPARKGSP